MSILGAFGISSPLISGAFTDWETNRAGDMADHAMDFNANQAQQNRDFQERMRATQYQTVVGDLKSAGLNPMLAYSQGSAGTPAGSMASGQPGTASRLGDGNANPLPAMQTAAQIDNIKAQTDNINADTENKRETNPVIRGQVGIQNATMGLLREQAAQTESYRYLNDEQRKLVNEQIRNAVLTGENIKADTRDTNANAVLRELDAPRARNMAESQSSAYMKYVAPYTGELGKITNSAADLARARRGFRNY